MRYYIFLLFLVCVMEWSVVPARAGAWTRFRGPNGQGIGDAAAVPLAWTSDDYRWRVQLPGTGSSSPVVDGDQIFITSGQDDGSRILSCRRTVDGGEIWTKTFAGAVGKVHSTNNFAPSTPVLDSQRVYTTWGSDVEYVVVALARADGEEVWRKNIGTFESIHGFGASPMLCQGRLILPCEHDGASFILALDPSTGETLWKTPRESKEACFSTPAVYTPEGGKTQLICASWAHGAYALDPEDGRVLWELPVMERRVVASPLLADGLVFISGGTGGIGLQMFAVRPGIPERGMPAEVAYEVKGRIPYVPTGVTKGDLVFLCWDKGELRCLRASTGEELGEVRVPDTFYASPILVQDRIYCVSRRGRLYVLSATEAPELLATVDLEEPSDATPAVADGVLYLRTQRHLMAVGGPQKLDGEGGRRPVVPLQDAVRAIEAHEP